MRDQSEVGSSTARYPFSLEPRKTNGPKYPASLSSEIRATLPATRLPPFRDSVTVESAVGRRSRPKPGLSRCGASRNAKTTTETLQHDRFPNQQQPALNQLETPGGSKGDGMSKENCSVARRGKSRRRRTKTRSTEEEQARRALAKSARKIDAFRRWKRAATFAALKTPFESDAT